MNHGGGGILGALFCFRLTDRTACGDNGVGEDPRRPVEDILSVGYGDDKNGALPGMDEVQRRSARAPSVG